ncbi:MAG: gamma-glutamyltransferase family protein [Candidatus Goldiibacteriota bacterium]
MNIKKIESSFSPDTKGKFSESENGMVSSAHPAASAAGALMLKKGGNAVDAAIAAAFTLGVCEPQASGLGGQTMMLISTEKKIISIDGSSRAPSLAHISKIKKEDKSAGYRASTVPGTPAALLYTLKKYGSLSRSIVMEPALAAASGGYKLTALQSRLLERESDKFNNIPSLSGSKYFLDNGKAFPAGHLFKQPDLANTLKMIIDGGINEFYRGRIASIIDADMKENKGFLRADDLALPPMPIERKPLKKDFRGMTVFTMPPPGSGRTLLFTLLMADQVPREILSSDQKNYIRLMCEIFRQALLERSDRPFDPNFFPQVNEKMLTKKHAEKTIKKIFSEIDRTLLPVIETPDETAGETTHLSVIDKTGMAVSLTQSIERVYGSKAAASGLGFLYNNYLFDYEYTDIKHPYYLRPNAVPWATVAPSLIFRGDSIWMAVGSPGSERIFSTISQFLINIFDNNMPLDAALKQPRFHCSLGGKVSLEDRFNQDIYGFLSEKGYRVDKREPYSFYLGAIHAVIKKSSGGFQGAAEIRRDGAAEGI